MKSFFTILTLIIASLTVAESQAASCTVSLVNGKGKVKQNFTRYSYFGNFACQDARRDCRDVKRSRYYPAPVQKCINAAHLVTKTCQAEMVSRRGVLVKTFSDNAVGKAGTGVKALACENAVRKCNNQRVNMGRHGATCTSITRRNGGYSRGPVVTRPSRNPRRARRQARY